MADFHFLISAIGDVMRLPDDIWPHAFPRRTAGWEQSDCGRIAFRLDADESANRFACGRRRSFGQGPHFDLTVDLSDGEVVFQRGHIGRMGVFYFQASDFTLVTNCLPDLLASVECRLDYGSALHYLSFGLPVPGHTLVAGVQALPAGHALRLAPSALPVRTRTFDILDHAEPTAPDADQVSAIAAAVDRAILRTAEGGGASLLLSAGIDSSYMATVLGDGVEACYTSSFPDLKATGEFDDARRYSRITGHRHHAVPIRTGDARAALERTLGANEPRSAWSAIVHDEICRTVGANGHRVLLSGLGADEVFGGYFQYVRSFRHVWNRALRIDPESHSNPLEVVLGSPRWYRGRIFTGVASFFDAAALKRAVSPPWCHWEPYQSAVGFYREALTRKPDAHIFETMIAHEAQHRIPDLLIRGFEASSHEQGLATGFPFLDAEVMKKGAALGADLRFTRNRKTGATRNKLLWREIAGRRLPEFVMNRPPSTYDAPIHDWFSDRGFMDLVCDAIRLPSLLDLGLFSGTWIAGFVDELQRLGDGSGARRVGLAEQAWILATFSAWQDRVLDAR